MIPELRDLFARVQRLENDLLRRPVILPQQIDRRPLYRQLRVGSGNALGTIDGQTYRGLKRAATLTSVPAATPATISTTYADGLTAAYDLGEDPTSTTGPLVWLTGASDLTVKDPGGGPDLVVSNIASFQLRDDQQILVISSYSVPISGAPGTYARVYTPAIVGV